MHPRNILVKVYGNIYPAGSDMLRSLQALCGEAVELEGDLLRLSFEGIWFPLEDVLEALRSRLTPACQGKLDYLDLEAWTLTRHIFTGTEITISSAPLNNVLDYSGH